MSRVPLWTQNILLSQNLYDPFLGHKKKISNREIGTCPAILLKVAAQSILVEIYGYKNKENHGQKSNKNHLRN